MPTRTATNQCPRCGQWAGRRHRCRPQSTPPTPALRARARAAAAAAQANDAPAPVTVAPATDMLVLGDHELAPTTPTFTGLTPVINTGAWVPDSVAQAPVTFEEWAYLEESRAQLKAVTDRAGEQLAARMELENVPSIPGPDGVTAVFLAGGHDYKHWDRDRLRPALIAHITASLPRVQDPTMANAPLDRYVARVLDEYDTFADTSDYRATALRDAGIDPDGYAEVTEKSRRAEVAGIPGITSIDASQALAASRADRTRLRGYLEQVRQPVFMTTFSPAAEASVSDAARDYATLQHTTAVLTVAAREAEHRLIAQQTATPGYTAKAGSGYRKWDRVAANAQIVSAIATRMEVSRGFVNLVVDRYNQVLTGVSYRVRPMSAAGIDPDTVSTKAVPRARLVADN